MLPLDNVKFQNIEGLGFIRVMQEVSTPSTSIHNQEIDKYLATKRISQKEDNLLWWKVNQRNFPNIAALARRYLGAPPTSFPSEQLFGGAGILFSPQCANLKGSTAQKLLFMKYNMMQGGPKF